MRRRNQVHRGKVGGSFAEKGLVDMTGVLAFGLYLVDEGDEGRTVKEIPEEHCAYVAACGNEM